MSAGRVVRVVVVGFGLFCAVAFAYEAFLLAPIGKRTR